MYKAAGCDGEISALKQVPEESHNKAVQDGVNLSTLSLPELYN